MFNAKESFINEVNKIKNNDLRTIAETLVEKTPEYFWHNAASSSGKYHPQCSLGEGGLVRHSIMTAVIAVDLLTSEVFIEDTQYNKDLVIFISLFHDILKYGENSTHTEFAHPIMSADFVLESLPFSNIDEDTAAVIYDAIRSHMGKWNTSRYCPDTILPTPATALQKLIHVADYISSRKYIGGLDDWGYISKNNKLTESDKAITNLLMVN